MIQLFQNTNKDLFMEKDVMCSMVVTEMEGTGKQHFLHGWPGRQTKQAGQWGLAFSKVDSPQTSELLVPLIPF